MDFAKLKNIEEGATVAGTPLEGVRVLDLSRVIMGPLATQILADQGADVIMVEDKGGDTSRVIGPGPHPELSGVALNLLRNKRSIELDLKSKEGRSTAHRLVKTCDVVVTTMRPSALTRLALDYETVRAIRPDIIYCQAQGFPLAGPSSDDPAYDDIIQILSGASELMERSTGQPGLLPTIFADKVCGLVIAQSVSAALFQRERTGMGQHIEVPMVQAIRAFVLVEHGSGAISEPPVHAPGQPAAGYSRVLARGRQPQPTKDGQVHLFPYLPKHYAALFGEDQVPESNRDPRYLTTRSAIANAEALHRDVRALGPLRTTDEWISFCRHHGIPAAPVKMLQDLVDELVLSRHPAAGQYRVIPQMVNFGNAPAEQPRPAPLIGENNLEVLEELVKLERVASSSSVTPEPS